MASKKDKRILYGSDLQKDENGDFILSMTKANLYEYHKCANDILYFAENYCYIFTVDGGSIKPILYEWQRKFLTERVATKPDGNPLYNDYILMAGRRSGKTISTAMFILHKILFTDLQKEKKIIIMSISEDPHALDILNMIKDMWVLLPKFLQRPVKRWLKSTIELMNGSWIRIAGVTQYGKVRGSGLSDVVLDESAFIPATLYQKFVSAVFPTVTTGKSYTITMMSTPYGFNHFYKIWTQAINGENGYGHMKVVWDEIPDHYTDDGIPVMRGEEFKIKMMKTLNLTAEQFEEEFNCTFLVTNTNSIFDLPDGMFKPTKPINNSINNCYTFYEHFDPNYYYTLGIDVAEGIGGDYSVIKVYKMLPVNIEEQLYKFEEVASYRNNEIDTYNFASVVEEFDELYPNNKILIENNNHGNVVLQALQLRENLDLDKIVSESDRRLGLMCTAKSKGLGFSTIKKLIKNSQIIIKDTITYTELVSYKGVNHKFKEVKTDKELEKLQERDGYKNQSSEHDDTVMATMWAVYILNMISTMYEIESFYQMVFEGEILSPEQILKKQSLFLLDEGKGLQSAKHNGLSNTSLINRFEGISIEAYDMEGNSLIDIDEIEDFDDFENTAYFQREEEAKDMVVREYDLFKNAGYVTNKETPSVMDMYR